MATGTFGTAINCIDGRAQAPVAEWLKTTCDVAYVDMVTVPGPDNALKQMEPQQIDDVRNAVAISVNAHHSQVIAIAGHHDCAAFPATKEEHAAAVRETMRLIAEWGLPARVIGLWVNEQWQIEVVADMSRP